MTRSNRSMVSIFSSLLLFAGAGLAMANDPALARAVSDSDLGWGPCPPFFGSGCTIAVLHGDGAKPNADVFFKVPGNYDLPAHHHTSAERMILVQGELHITYEGQAEAVLKPGMYAYGPPKANHWGRCVGPDDCILFIAFEEPIDATQVAQPSE